MKTSDLIGPALAYAAGIAEGFTPHAAASLVIMESYNPDTNWAQAGPIIERECIATYASGACSVAPKNPDYWVAEILDTAEMLTQYGPTPLIAAMRAFVASRLGDEVEIPSELQP